MSSSEATFAISLLKCVELHTLWMKPLVFVLAGFARWILALRKGFRRIIQMGEERLFNWEHQVRPGWDHRASGQPALPIIWLYCGQRTYIAGEAPASKADRIAPTLLRASCRCRICQATTPDSEQSEASPQLPSAIVVRSFTNAGPPTSGATLYRATEISARAAS